MLAPVQEGVVDFPARFQDVLQQCLLALAGIESELDRFADFHLSLIPELCLFVKHRNGLRPLQFCIPHG